MNKKIVQHIIIVSIMFFLLPVCQVSGKNFTVVIDPGHGGRDPGALGSSSKEKDIVLAVSLKVGKLISDNHKDVDVIYTRSTDKYLTLDQRAQLANSKKGDLFISIHTNAAENKTVRGTETFTLGLAKTEENLKLAMRENAVMLLEDDYLQKYEGFDPKSSESYIIFEFMQSIYMEQSIGLASEIENAFKSSVKRSSRGVKQAGFWVLSKTTMPSVLIELGFISNKDEEAFLKSAAGQDKLAGAIYSAFSKYKNDYDRKQGVLTVSNNGNGNKPVSAPKATNSTPAPATATAAQQTAGKIVYKVQVLASEKKLAANSRELKGYKDLDFYQEGGLYKYTYGETTDYEEIRKIRRKVAQDFKDAFIVKFKDGKKINN